MNRPYLYTFRRFLIWLRQSFNVVWLILVAGYLMVLAGNAVYRNYQAQEQTAGLQNQLIQAQQQQQRLRALLVYYQTDAYKEKELRRALLLVKPGEKAYALPESSNPRSLEDIATHETVAVAKKNVSDAPIWEQWVHYLWTGQKGG